MASQHLLETGKNGTLTAKGVCPITKKEWTLESLDSTAYFSWVDGMLIQLAFPNLSPDQRELLVSGTSAEGWKQLFGEGEE